MQCAGYDEAGELISNAVVKRTAKRMLTLTLRRLCCPSTFVTMAGIVLIVNVAISTQIVTAQGGVADAGSSAIGQLAQIIGIATSLGIFVMFLVGLVWFVWKGKDVDALTKKNATLRDDNEDLRTKNAELKVELAETRVARLSREKEAEELRKANLRLQGIKDA